VRLCIHPPRRSRGFLARVQGPLLVLSRYFEFHVLELRGKKRGGGRLSFCVVDSMAMRPVPVLVLFSI